MTRPITFVQTIFPGLDSFDLSNRSVSMGAGRVLSGMAAGLLMISPVVAAETITYTYAAKRRLVNVKRTDKVNNNVPVNNEHNKANTPTRQNVTHLTQPSTKAGPDG